MPFTVHPDLRAYDLGAYLISQKGQVFSFYDYLSRLDSENMLVQNFSVGFFIYPPLAYLIPAVFMAVLAPLYNFAINDLFLLRMESVYQNSLLFFNLFLLKIPYLVFDLLLGYLLFKLFNGEKGRTAFKLWMLNPVTLYATFAMGQADIFPTFFIVLALYFALKSKNILAVAMLGLGGAFKLTPLLLLPIFVLLLENDTRNRLKLAVLGMIPYLVVVAPYLLTSPIYRQSALLADQTQKMLYMKLPVSGAESISVFALGYFLLIFLTAKLSGQKEQLWKLCFGVFLLFFSTTHYHPQWFLWMTPFLIWDLVLYGKKHLWYLGGMFIIFVFLTLMFETSLHVGLLSPVFPQLIDFPNIADSLNKSIDIFQYKSLARTLFASLSVIVFLDLLLPAKKRE